MTARAGGECQPQTSHGLRRPVISDRTSAELTELSQHELSTHPLEALPVLSDDALHAVVNEIGHPVVLMSMDGAVLQQNDAARRVIEDASERASGVRRFCPFLHEPDGTPRMREFIDSTMKTGQRQQREISRFGRWWRIHLVPLRNQQKEIRCLLLLAEDVSFLKIEQECELAREKALTQTLVREVHHRIKNHLQGLIGLLRVNSDAWHSVREAIDGAIVQIQSIAIVHGLLAQSGGTSIGFWSLLEQLVATVRISARIPVSCSVDSPDSERIEVPQEEAVSLAVVVGELLTNAVKHTSITPISRVEGHLRCPGDAIELTVINFPAQLPAGFSLDRSVNTGLDLIRTLLPRDRSHLAITQSGNAVTTRLHFRPMCSHEERLQPG